MIKKKKKIKKPHTPTENFSLVYERVLCFTIAICKPSNLSLTVAFFQLVIVSRKCFINIEKAITNPIQANISFL